MAGRRLAKAFRAARMASKPRSGLWAAGRLSHLYLKQKMEEKVVRNCHLSSNTHTSALYKAKECGCAKRMHRIFAS
jgi:hypothetical protein